MHTFAQMNNKFYLRPIENHKGCCSVELRIAQKNCRLLQIKSVGFRVHQNNPETLKICDNTREPESMSYLHQAEDMDYVFNQVGRFNLECWW